MRILHVTDFHFRKHWFQWVEKVASNYDAVCFTGDFLDGLRARELNAQIR
jgi:predicted MPP superfamily phosphohydrolase